MHTEKAEKAVEKVRAMFAAREACESAYSALEFANECVRQIRVRSTRMSFFITHEFEHGVRDFLSIHHSVIREFECGAFSLYY